MKVLLTGASGFVGAHVLRHLLMNTDWEILAPVSFRHKGLPERIESSVCGDPAWARRVDLPHWDMINPASPALQRAATGCDVFMNVASESHVDRSIEDPADFVSNNVQLMLNVLDLARAVGPRLFLQMSTDEVYGPAYGDTLHQEWDPIVPSNPYAASKAMQEALCTSYWRTYGVPVVTTNTMNIVGEMQDPEKFVPMIIRNVLAGKPQSVHCAPDGTPGSRFYLHARNLADAWLYLTQWYLGDGIPGAGVGVPSYARGFARPDRYHIVGEREVDNVSLVHMIAGFLGREAIVDKVSFHSSRPGHDLRYALDGSKLARLGWRAPVSLEDGLRKTVNWTLEHPEWLEL